MELECVIVAAAAIGTGSFFGILSLNLLSQIFQLLNKRRQDENH